MFGFGVKIRHVFTSRWKAAIWSLGVLLTAYCTVPDAEQPNAHPAKPSSVQQVNHKSPWAKD